MAEEQKGKTYKLHVKCGNCKHTSVLTLPWDTAWKEGKFGTGYVASDLNFHYIPCPHCGNKYSLSAIEPPQAAPRIDPRSSISNIEQQLMMIERLKGCPLVRPCTDEPEIKCED